MTEYNVSNNDGSDFEGEITDLAGLLAQTEGENDPDDVDDLQKMLNEDREKEEPRNDTKEEKSDNDEKSHEENSSFGGENLSLDSLYEESQSDVDNDNDNHPDNNDNDEQNPDESAPVYEEPETVAKEPIVEESTEVIEKPVEVIEKPVEVIEETVVENPSDNDSQEDATNIFDDDEANDVPVRESMDIGILDDELAQKFIATLDAYRALTDDDKKVVAQSVTEDNDINASESKVMVGVLSSNPITLETFRVFEEASRESPVDRVFFIFQLDDSLLSSLGDLVSVFSSEPLKPGKRLDYVRQIVSRIENLDDKFVSLAESVESVLSAPEKIDKLNETKDSD